jgi:carboxylesterase type B
MHFLSTTLALLSLLVSLASSKTTVQNEVASITYHGTSVNGIEKFLGIRYGESTAGANRFRPPIPFVYPEGTAVNATAPGSACPQTLGQQSLPLAVRNITDVSEDCLNLNIARPSLDWEAEKVDPLPVIVWIHGGSFWSGSNYEPTTFPDGMIKQSLNNDEPIIHVALNYRLGCKLRVICYFAQQPEVYTDSINSLWLCSVGCVT